MENILSAENIDSADRSVFVEGKTDLNFPLNTPSSGGGRIAQAVLNHRAQRG